MRITVVLPQPEGPTKTTNSPSWMSIDKGSTTGMVPPSGVANSLATLLMRMKLPFCMSARPVLHPCGKGGERAGPLGKGKR